MAAKPLILQMLKDVLPALDLEHIDELTLYEQHVRMSLERKWHDLRDERSRVLDDDLLANLLTILESVAVRLHTSAASWVDLRHVAVGGSTRLAEVLWRMADGSSGSADNEVAHQDARARVGTRSLLRPVVGVDDAAAWPVDFFHRSIREYFVARAIVRALTAGAERAALLLGHVPLQPEIVNFTVQMMRANDDPLADRLLYLVRTAVHPQPAGWHVGGNALTLLYRLLGHLPSDDWSGLALDHADLSGADLTGMSLRGSTLTHANLDNTVLVRADLREADLTGVALEQTAPTVALAVDGTAVIAAYRDNTMRRWTVEPGDLITSHELTRMDFAVRQVERSPFGDLVVLGHREAVVLGPGGDEALEPVARFEVRPGTLGLSTWDSHLGVHHGRSPGVPVLRRFDLASGASLYEIQASTSEPWRLVGPTGAIGNTTHGVSVHWGAFGAKQTEVFGPVVSADATLLGPSAILLLTGHDNGEIVAHQLTLGSVQTDPVERWRVSAHDSPVTAIRVAPGFFVSAASDRTVKLFRLHNGAIIGDPLRLHRSLRCDGMRVDGVRGPRERELLLALINENAIEAAGGEPAVRVPGPRLAAAPRPAMESESKRLLG